MSPETSGGGFFTRPIGLRLHGILARYKLKIPESTKASSHTVLSYRWDTYENNEVFVGCADIAITTDGGDAAPVTPDFTPN